MDANTLYIGTAAIVVAITSFVFYTNRAAPKKTLYDELGGAAAIDAVVEKFYDERVLKDPITAPLFKNTNMSRQKIHQKNFITFATGGPNNYSGRGMKAVHAKLGITEEHWNAVCGHLVGTLKDLGVTQRLIDQVVKTVAPLHDDIVG
mmetsp:Transcript_32091/g.50432  ORF Transcript_32091/g.50432 Transcript_32091/m.50432 type:complete len:148 (+) Transcript_32091:93-536(+)